MEKIMIAFLVGILVSLGVVTPSYSVGVAAWCTVAKDGSTVECNYKTKADCEIYRSSDETCQKNPEPGKKY